MTRLVAPRGYVEPYEGLFGRRRWRGWIMDDETHGMARVVEVKGSDQHEVEQKLYRFMRAHDEEAKVWPKEVFRREGFPKEPQ